MAIDFGERRIGIALSDPSRIISSPYMTIDIKKTPLYIKKIKDIILEKDVGKLIIGYPLNNNKNKTKIAEKIKNFTRRLKKNIKIPIVYWDESFTTVEAETVLHKQNRRLKRHKKTLDKIAAALILQDYMKNIE